jgi:Tfp pilus assembly protein PilF
MIRTLLLLVALVLAAPSVSSGAAASVVTLLRQSQQAEARGQAAQAMELVNQALDQDPGYPPLWRQKASLQITTNDYDGALDTLAVLLKAEPDDLESNVLELTALLRLGDKGTSRLEQYVSGVKESMAAALIENILPRSQAKADLTRLLAVWKPASADGETVKRLAAGYAKGDDAALRELADAPAPAAQKNVIAALQFQAGKEALAGKRVDLSQALLDKALANGYDPVAVTGELGWVRYNQGQPNAAADLWESHWRDAPDVGLWAGWIADARLTAKDYPRAADFLEKTLQFSPTNALYQGQYLFALRASGQNDKADAFEEKLRADSEQDGLHFGLAMTAWNRGDDAGAAEEFSQIKNRRPFRDRIIELADAMVGSIGAKGDPTKVIASIENLIKGLDVRGNILRDIGWRLWAAKRPDTALSFWRQSLEEGLPAGDPLVARVAPLLIETGRTGEAMALLRAYAPEVTPLGLAWSLAAANRWDIVGKVLPAVPAGPYPDLLGAMAALQGGQPQVALDKMRVVSALPAGGFGQAAAVGFSPEGQIVRGSLSPAVAGEIYLHIARTLVEYQMAQGFFFLTPPAWASGVSPRAMAPVWAGAGRVLWTSGQYDQAAGFLERALAADPGQTQAMLYLALYAKRRGDNAKAQSLLDRALAKAAPFDRSYALGEFALLDGNAKAALAHFQEAVSLAPSDTALRLRVIGLLAADRRYDEARRMAGWFDAMVAKGDRAVFSAAAAAKLELGDAKGAEALYRTLLATRPASLDPLSGLGLALNRQSRYAETVAALSHTYADTASPLLGGVLCEALLSLGEYQEVLNQAEIGLAKHPENKELLRQAAEAAEFAKDPALCEAYARRYLELDPDSSIVQNMFAQALLDQKKYDEAQAHYTALLKKNPAYLPAARGNFNIFQYTGKAAKAYKAAQELMKLAPDNATLRLQYAVAAAADQDFRPAYPALHTIRDFGPGSPVLCLYYADVRDAETPGKVRLSQMADHLRAIAAAGGSFLGADDLANRPSGDAALQRRDTNLAPQVFLIVDRTDAAVLEKIDALLAEVGGKAMLVVGGESLTAGTPYLPDLAMVRALAGNGRWSLALTDHNPPPVDGRPPGALHLWNTCGALACPPDETPGARLAARLHALDLQDVILGAARPVFFYPGGDAPRDILGASDAGREAYRKLVTDTFPMAFELNPDGYWTPVSDPHRIAAKSVAPSLDTAGLTRYLEQVNPMRQVSLELAKVYSWQEQLGQAENYFKEAGALKANPADLTYHEAVNAYYMYDDPVAVTRAQKAVAVDPEAERTRIQLARAELRTRPKAEASVNTWWDSDNRRYWWYGLRGEVHVLDSLVVFAKGGRVEWSIDSYQRRGKMLKAISNTLENGSLSASDVYKVLHSRRTQYLDGEDLVVGARWFFYPEFWLEAQGQLTDTDGGPGAWLNGQATLHGPFAPKGAAIDGAWDIQAAHERIDTVEAISEQIMANRVSLFTHNRILNYYDLFLNLHGISRTDGNNTGSMDGRLLARLFEYPLFSLGYAFQFANSDRNPIQYWAPLDLVTHLAYASFGFAPTRWFNGNGSVGYGPSRDRSNDWRNIWRVNAGMDITLKERLKFSVKYSYFSSPTYNLNEIWAGINYTF